MTATKIRVIVVEDSLTVRRAIVEALTAEPEIEVIAEAADGLRGIELCGKLRPDVATFDMVLPGTDGLAAVEHIMAYFPTPIVIVSASTNRGELLRTYDALAAGAVDVLEKPRADEPEGAWERRLVAIVKLASRIKVITHPRARLRDLGTRRPPPPVEIGGQAPSQTPRLVALGASTGGPGAVSQILRGLPAGFPLPVLVVIHIGESFAASLVDWLATQSTLPVMSAQEGEPLPPEGVGRVIVAPCGRHLILRRGRLLLTTDPERNHCRPSVDVLFESIAAELGARATACLLTGMGKDGAEGLAAVLRAGGTTIAQDEATSVVFGMPREAILRGAARHVLPIGRIATALSALAKGAKVT